MIDPLMLVTCHEMRALEEAVFARGISADFLMERVGSRMAQAIQQWFPNPGHLVIFSGKGHNAGDAFVVARHLATRGWTVSARFVSELNALQPLTMSKFEAVKDVVLVEEIDAATPRNRGPLLILDGLLGIGAQGTLRGTIRDACSTANRLRYTQRATTIAVDIPTGVDGDTGEVDEYAIVADFTLTVAAAKVGLVADEAINHVGRLEVIPIEELEPDKSAGAPQVADKDLVRSLLPRRSFDTHKGTAGRVGIIAGSVGLTGAARLSSSAALHSGAGLVTLLVPEKIWSALAIACPPEIMVRPLGNIQEIEDYRFDAIGIGPGLGGRVSEDLLNAILHLSTPMVVDADAINAISRNGAHCLSDITAPRLLTPHPGEMERLQPGLEKSRSAQASIFTDSYPVNLLLKGARTIIATSGKSLTYNTTGCPGMASGGMGDVLTGICTALIAQKMETHESGIVGSWLLGRAAEIAVSHHGYSTESLSACAVIDALGSAFSDLELQ